MTRFTVPLMHVQVCAQMADMQKINLPYQFGVPNMIGGNSLCMAEKKSYHDRARSLVFCAPLSVALSFFLFFILFSHHPSCK